MTDYKALRKAADRATPGPWATSTTSREPEALMVDIPDGPDDVMSLAWHAGGGICVFSQTDAQFIAAFDPPTVLALLAKAEAFDRLTSDEAVERAARAMARRAGAEFDWPNFELSARVALTAALEGRE